MICRYFLTCFRFTDDFLCCAGIFSFDVVSLVYFFPSLAFVFDVKSKKTSLRPTSSPRSFLALGLMFKFLIYFELIKKSFKMSI